MSEDKDNSKQPEITGDVPLDAIRHPDTMYDRTDLSARGILYFLIALTITVTLIHIISWSFVRYFAGNQVRPAPRNAAIVTPAKEAGPRGSPALRFPAPRLQADPVADLNKFRAAEEEHLNGTGWLDRKNGVAYIPIQRAIDRMAQQGLPVRPAPVLPPKANFGSGDGTPAGEGGGTAPLGNK